MILNFENVVPENFFLSFYRNINKEIHLLIMPRKKKIAIREISFLLVCVETLTNVLNGGEEKILQLLYFYGWTAGISTQKKAVK